MFQSSKIIKQLFYANVAVYIIGILLQLVGFPFYEIFALYPQEGFMIHQLITYQFLHGGLMHIAFNMLALISIGPTVANYLGERKFLIYYLISGIGSAFLHMLMVKSAGPLVGASGSIFGILLMFAILNPNEKLYFYFLIPIKSKYLISVIFAIEVYCAFFVTGDGIGHFGHIGGGITGAFLLLIDKVLPAKPKKKRWS